MMELKIRYFAILREQAGREAETVQVAGPTLKDVYEELQAKHDFSLPVGQVRAAVAQNYVPLETTVESGMEVVFIPPVAGG